MKFYLTAILFVVFDIEAVFIYPWAVQFRSLGMFGLIEMFGFLAVVVVALDLRLEERSTRMGELMAPAAGNRLIALEGSEAGFATTRLEDLLGWARKYSLFAYPFVTACCGMEFMAPPARVTTSRASAPRRPRFSPRQADLLWVVGTISQRQAPVLRRIYEQMMEPKYVLAFGTCASCGGFYDNYTTVAGHRQDHPDGRVRPGLSPRPEAVLDGLMLLQDKIARGDRTPGIVKPREDPTQTLVSIRKVEKTR